MLSSLRSRIPKGTSKFRTGLHDLLDSAVYTQDVHNTKFVYIHVLVPAYVSGFTLNGISVN